MNPLMRAAYEEKKRLIQAFWGDTPEGNRILFGGFGGKDDECYKQIANYMNSIGATTMYGKPITVSVLKRWRYRLCMPFLTMRRRHGSSMTLLNLLAWMWATGDVTTLRRRF